MSFVPDFSHTLKVKKTYLTTSIAYINAEPHIGFLYELLAADVLKRYRRLLGEEVFLLTGTDEHGIKVAKAAEKAKQPPQKFADKLSAKFKDLGQQFNIDFDYFVRTTDDQHVEFVREKWRELAKGDLLQKKTYSGLYCSGCEAFKTDSEIKDGRCLVHEIKLEKVEEENWFLVISYLRKRAIRDWIDSAVFPTTRRQEVINTLESGAYDEVSVSRPKAKNTWGVEVPGDPDQVMYVWVDALLNYLSAIEASGQKIDSLWPADIQIVGKDIVKFHAIIWPTVLLALGYKLPKKLLVHGFINVNGKKMSKTLGNVIAPKQLIDRYGVEASRYLLFRGLSFYDDSNFTWGDFDNLYNGELANGLGNLVARVIGLLTKSAVKKEQIGRVFRAVEKKYRPGQSLLRGDDFAGELKKVNRLLNEADKWITATKPWENEAILRGSLTGFSALRQLFEASYLLQPFMPKTAIEIRRQLTELDSQPLFMRLAK